ncbi:MAG: gamma-glutamyltransferase [Proteobacteria bacterium]|nr:gamma-glutamyltransferase [Burkholderiales bacterium]
MQTMRPPIMGTRHVVSAGHYLAAHAAFEILEGGGNAIDAGVAAGIALGVTQTEKVNFGGVAPIIIFRAETRELISIDGLGVWPRAITPDFFMKHHGGKIPATVLRSIVPAAPDAWLTALELHGTMSFGEVAAASIRLARDGFPMHALMSEFLKENESSYQRYPSSYPVFFPGGRAPEPGEVFRQTDLGRTLQYMADEERAAASKVKSGGRGAGLQAARDAFYKGDIARAIVKFHAENGGLMSAEDLAEFRVRIEPTVSTTYAGVEVHACGPWCQGPVMPMTLNLLKGFDLKAMGHNSTPYIHRITEALKLAFSDRHHFFGDPRFVDVPIADLMSQAYADERARMIRADVAWPEMPPPGDPRNEGDARLAPMPIPEPADKSPLGDTSYACVVDRHGNAFSVTPSDGSNNSPLIPGLGIVCSGRGTQSWADPRYRASVAPGVRPRLTPNPALALKDGKVFMPLGTPGGDVQCQAMVQVFLNVVLFGMDPQAAIEAPRFSTYSFPGSFEPHPYFPGQLALEGRIDRAVGTALDGLGHQTFWWDDYTWLAGAPCAIVVDPVTGVRSAGADPRRPAYALGW